MVKPYITFDWIYTYIIIICCGDVFEWFWLISFPNNLPSDYFLWEKVPRPVFQVLKYKNEPIFWRTLQKEQILQRAINLLSSLGVIRSRNWMLRQKHVFIPQSKIFSSIAQWEKRVTWAESLKDRKQVSALVSTPLNSHEALQTGPTNKQITV